MQHAPTATWRPGAIASGLPRAAAATPDALAVCDLDRRITFAELDSLAARLAARLIAPSANRSEWLPIVVDRSVSTVVALNGAIRAGRPFVPIEANLPRERIDDLLARIGHPTEILLAHAALRSRAPSDLSQIVAEEVGSDSVGPQPIDPEAPALIVFTSGSTGRPKGVVRPWRGLEDSMTFTADTAAGSGPERVGQLRPFSFTGGINRLGSIASGDSLHIADPSTMDVDSLLSWIDDEMLTSMSFGSAIASTVLRVTQGARRLPTVTTLRMGGQAAGWEFVEPLRALASERLCVYSGFGATEAGSVMRWSIGPDDPIEHGPLPLGRPNEARPVRLEPVDGDPTMFELYVGNPAALGYFDDPDLNAARFHVDERGVRWWRSGDIISVDERGLHHHRGRLDDMVKINGLLVEPAEPERVLRALPGLSAAAVVVHRTPSGADRLIGHVVVDDPTVTPEAVRAELEATLPKHLVPAMLVRHDALPMNERTKIDRTVLRDAELVRWRSAPPRRTTDELELWMTDQVAGILDLGEVGPDDDIWHLGLDSLGAVELCAIIADAGFPDTAPTTLLEQRTPAAIAAGLSSVRPTERGSCVVLNPDGTLPPLFVIPGGGGTSLAFRAVADHMPHRPIVVIEPRGMHQHGPVDRTLDGVVTNILNEIDLRLDPETPCTILGYSAGGTPAFEVARRRHEHRRSTHLVLLDTAPTRSRRTAPEPGDTQPAPTRTPAEFIARVRRGLHRRWLVLRPGPPSYSSIRYDAFRTIGSRANATYQPVVLDVPATLIHVAGNNTTERCAPWLPDLETHQVNGGHLSMLRPPHATELAHVLTSVINTTNHRLTRRPSSALDASLPDNG